MKQVFTIFITFLTFACGAQDFMGIKPEGTLTDVVSKVKSKGFKVMSEKDDFVILFGEVDGEIFSIAVSCTPITKQVHALIVYLPERKGWESLKNQFTFYFEVLKLKYGKPLELSTSFKNPYKEGDGLEIEAIKTGFCEYRAKWKGVNIGFTDIERVKIIYTNSLNEILFAVESEKLEKSKIF